MTINLGRNNESSSRFSAILPTCLHYYRFLQHASNNQCPNCITSRKITLFSDLMRAIQKTTQQLKNSFPNTQILPTYGNHDHAPSGLFAEDDHEFYNRTFELWKNWIGEDKRVRHGDKKERFISENVFKRRVLFVSIPRHYVPGSKHKLLLRPRHFNLQKSRGSK